MKEVFDGVGGAVSVQEIASAPNDTFGVNELTWLFDCFAEDSEYFVKCDTSQFGCDDCSYDGEEECADDDDDEDEEELDDDEDEDDDCFEEEDEEELDDDEDEANKKYDGRRVIVV